MGFGSFGSRSTGSTRRRRRHRLAARRRPPPLHHGVPSTAPHRVLHHAPPRCSTTPHRAPRGCGVRRGSGRGRRGPETAIPIVLSARPEMSLHFAPPALNWTNSAELRSSFRLETPHLESQGGVKWWKPGGPGGRRRVEEVAPVEEFLGTHTPRLDDKGRLFLPARFRAALAGGLVVTTGQEGCLYVFPTAEFHRISALMQSAPGLVAAGARLRARVPRQRPPRHPGQAGPRHVPAAAAHLRAPRQGVHGHRQRQPARGLGLRRLGRLPRRGHARVLLLLRGLARRWSRGL